MTFSENKNLILFSTRKSVGLYSYIINSVKKHAEKNLKKKLDLYEYSNKKNLSRKIIFNFFKIFVETGFFNTKKLVNYNLLGTEIGRHVISTCYSDYRSHFNSIIFFYKKIVYLVYALNLLFEIQNKEKFIQAIYLDHGVYLNGIIINYFSTRKKIIYTNNYPRGLFCKPIELNQFLTYENLLAIKYENSFNKKNQNKKLDRILKNNLKNPTNSYPWMKQKIFKNFDNVSLGQIDYVIYSHAFTDAQLQFGYDGFITSEEWLKFTLDVLIEKKSKVLVKAHPNFNKYNNNFRSKFEIEIFNKIKGQYKDYSNILFLSDPIKNIDVLNKLNNKKTALITHHGTTILEGSNLNFKFITYNKNFWSNKFKLTNIWKNKEQYKTLLNKNFKDLKYPNKNHTYNLCKKIFLNDFGFVGKDYYLNKISAALNLDKINLIDGISKPDNFNSNNKSHVRLVHRLLNSIETIN